MENDDHEPDLDDLMQAMGFEKPVINRSPEDEFLVYLTFGATPRIINLLHWLKHIIGQFEYLLEKDINITVTAYDKNIVGQKPVSRENYTRLMVEYYLYMCHLPRFDKNLSATGKVCDMKVTLDRIMCLEDVKAIFSKKS